MLDEALGDPGETGFQRCDDLADGGPFDIDGWGAGSEGLKEDGDEHGGHGPNLARFRIICIAGELRRGLGRDRLKRVMTAEEQLTALGIVLPEAPKAVGSYVTWVRTGNLVVTSGQLPWESGRMRWPGRLGEEIDTDRGYQAARLAGLNAIAQLKAATGDLEKVRRIVRLEGNVHCGENFREHPRVLDGASELLIAVFGERGWHTRTAIGVRDMPLNACVQLSVWAEVE